MHMTWKSFLGGVGCVDWRARHMAWIRRDSSDEAPICRSTQLFECLIFLW